MTKRIAFIVALAGLFAAFPAHAGPYTFTTIDVPGAFFGTFASDVNNSGAVAGDFQDGVTGFAHHGFIYAGGTYTTIDEPDAQQGGTSITGINDSNTVVGSYFTTLGGHHGFMFDGTTYTTIDNPLGTLFGSIATSINDAGAIAGQYFDSTGTHGYVYQGGTFTTVDDPLGVGATFVTDIRNDGAVAGYFQDASGTHGFTDVGGVFTTIDNPAADANGTLLYGFNAGGAVSGRYSDGSGTHGFYDAGGIFTPLDDLAANANFGGGFLGPGTFGAGMNDGGQVTGAYLADGTYHGFVATPESASVPTPGTLALFGVGLVLVWVFGKRTTRIHPPA